MPCNNNFVDRNFNAIQYKLTRRSVYEGGGRVEAAGSTGLKNRLKDTFVQHSQLVTAEIDGRAIGVINLKLKDKMVNYKYLNGHEKRNRKRILTKNLIRHS